MFGFLFGKKRRENNDTLKPVRELIARGDVSAAEEALRAGASAVEHAARLRELLLGERRNEEAAEIARELAEREGPEAAVSKALLAHLSGDFATAIRACETALDANPDLATAHNHLGRALHNAGRTDEALAAFRRAVELAPDYAEAWHNFGHALRARGELEPAVEAFRKALEQAPGFRMARLNLGITLFNLERGAEALQCFERLLGENPRDAEALVNAGLCLQMLGRFDDAREHYQQAISIAPDMAVAHFYLGVLLNERTDTRGALAALERALELDPGDVEAWIELAGVYEQANRLDRAGEAVRRAAALAPGHPALEIETAKLERRRGDVDAAARRLRQVDAGRLPARLAQQYFFELGQALDRAGDADGAFEAFSAGKRIAARNPRRRTIDTGAFPKQCDRMLRWLEAGALGAEPRPEERTGDEGAELCFLVGFPRSGTTLLDTMLDVHPDVASVEERRTLEVVIDRIESLQAGYPDAMKALAPETVVMLRGLYWLAVDELVPPEQRRLVVDKLPLRSLHAALIHRLFPQAKILFALRHPCDVVLSNFMQQYAVNEAFVHFDTLEDCCRTYDRVMRVWQAAEDRLALNAAYLRYEALVAEPAATLDGVCGFLGIERHDQMLDADARLATRDRVRTNSYQQVGEAIYQRAAGRWQRYRRHLEPYFPLLEPHVVRFGYSLEEAPDA